MQYDLDLSSANSSADNLPSSSNADTSTARGLHTLVDGLTLDEPPSTTHAASPSASSGASLNPSSELHTSLFSRAANSSTSPSSSSIFNNPHAIATPSSSPSDISGAGSITPSPASRVLSYDVGSRSAAFMKQLASSAGGSSSRSSGKAVKEVDDPTSNPAYGDRMLATPQTLGRLYASQPSPIQTPQHKVTSYRGLDSVKLEDFLYNRGFLQGTCSDVTIIAFGTHYRLHRLILDRSPFFSSCFNGGPWLESTSSEIELSPETSDPNITQIAFEAALARLYGHVDREKEEKLALPLLAAASYLELQDLAESCVSSLLRGLKTSNISSVIRFVTNSYYGPLTDRLLQSSKALLYRDGWEIPFSEWDGISGEIAAEIAGYEGFYVPTEYARHCFVKELIDWRLKNAMAARAHDSDHTTGTMDSVTDDPDIKPLQDLLENGIHYIHMSFEELQKIMADRNVLGRPPVSPTIITRELWQQMLLRQKVLNAAPDNAELGITQYEYNTDNGKNSTRPSSFVYSNISPTGERKYYIPTEDSTTAIGDCPDQPPQVVYAQRGLARPGDAVLPSQPSSCANGSGNSKESEQHTASPGPGETLRYSFFPPFRFSAEFRGVRNLKERKRVYSKTVFYAGSYWNIYIQKVKSSKNIQLGVYLHRAKDRDGSGSSGSSASTANRDGEVTQIATIDERGQLIQRRGDHSGGNGTATGDDMNDSTNGMMDGTDIASSTFSSLIPPRSGVAAANTSASRTGNRASSSFQPQMYDQSRQADSQQPQQDGATGASMGVPAVGHYVDSRATILTYFKIFSPSPSRKGKMVSMFSSGPDYFNFSQSWGWKSSSLISEEGGLLAATGAGGSDSQNGGHQGEKEKEKLERDRDGNTVLRFMVVLGMC